MLPLIRASQVAPFLQAAERIGIPTRRYLDRVRLPEVALQAPGRMIARHQLWQFADVIAQREGVPGFGFEAAAIDPVGKLGAFGRQILAAPTLAVALSRLARKIGDHSTHAHFRSVRVAGGVCVTRRDEGYLLDGSEVVEQYILTLLVGIVRGAAPGWRPRRVWLRGSAGAWTIEHEALAEAQLRGECGLTGIEVPMALLALPMRSRTRGVPAARELGSEVPRDFAGALRLALTPLVGHVRLDLNVASDFAGVNPRTVRRRLISEGTTWRALLDDLRLEYARTRLADPDLRFVEIALELGYADSAHFTRAFRRWTRVTPSQFRNGLSVGRG